MAIQLLDYIPEGELDAGIDADDTTFDLVDATGWPAGPYSPPLPLLLSPRTAGQEWVDATDRSGTTVTIVREVYQAGASHSAGAKIRHGAPAPLISALIPPTPPMLPGVRSMPFTTRGGPVDNQLTLGRLQLTIGRVGERLVTPWVGTKCHDASGTGTGDLLWGIFTFPGGDLVETLEFDGTISTFQEDQMAGTLFPGYYGFGPLAVHGAGSWSVLPVMRCSFDGGYGQYSRVVTFGDTDLGDALNSFAFTGLTAMPSSVDYANADELHNLAYYTTLMKA